jgi:hypothetical protein
MHQIIKIKKKTMKNKNLLLLLGAGLAYYLFYKMYAKKTTTNDVKKPVMSPVLNNLDKSSIYLVDNVKTAELDYTPNTYQTFYGKINGQNNKVPSTC